MDVYGNYGLFAASFGFFLLVLFVRYLRRFLLFSMVLNSGRLSGASFRLS